MSAETLVTLADAREDFVDNVVSVMYSGVFGAIDTCAAEAAGGKTSAFQRKLREVPGWNQAAVERLANQMLVKNPEFTFLLRSLFVAWVRVLIFRRRAGAPANVRILAPNNAKFVHAVMVNVAAWIFEHVTAYKQSTSEDKAGILGTAIKAAVRQLLPLKDVLQLYLGENIHTEDLTPALQDHESSGAPNASEHLQDGPLPDPSEEQDFGAPPPYVGDDFEGGDGGAEERSEGDGEPDGLDHVLSDHSLAELRRRQETEGLEHDRTWQAEYGNVEDQLPLRGAGGIAATPACASVAAPSFHSAFAPAAPPVLRDPTAVAVGHPEVRRFGEPPEGGVAR